MSKYNIYIICKTEEDFLEKSNDINDIYKNKICHIQWIPAEYLKLTQCNKKLLKDLNTRWNTSGKKTLAKLGNIAAHRKALLAIYMNKTDNNIILESDAEFSSKLCVPPSKSCYMGGWIIPPQISKAGEKVNINPKKGLNTIDYDKFAVIMTHALFLKTFEEAIELFQTTITEKIKNYDIHLKELEYLEYFHYPPIFVQGKHVSEIEGNTNQNDKHTFLYGLNE